MSDVSQVNPINVPAGATIIDVREDYEWEAGHVAGAQHLVLNELPERLDELPKGENFYVICHGGGRSNQATEYMRENRYQANNIAEGKIGRAHV